MAEEIINKLKIMGGKLGYVVLSDGSIIILRVAVIDVRIREEQSLFGADFEVNATNGISVYPSKEALREVEDKPVIEPGKIVNEGWVRIDITSKQSAYEEVMYTDEKIGRYVIRVEIEPIMASKNTRFKTIQGWPLYVVRWVPKITWREVSENEGKTLT